MPQKNKTNLLPGALPKIQSKVSRGKWTILLGLLFVAGSAVSLGLYLKRKYKTPTTATVDAKQTTTTTPSSSTKPAAGSTTPPADTGDTGGGTKEETDKPPPPSPPTTQTQSNKTKDTNDTLATALPLAAAALLFTGVGFLFWWFFRNNRGLPTPPAKMVSPSSNEEQIASEEALDHPVRQLVLFEGAMRRFLSTAALGKDGYLELKPPKEFRYYLSLNGAQDTADMCNEQREELDKLMNRIGGKVAYRLIETRVREIFGDDAAEFVKSDRPAWFGKFERFLQTPVTAADVTLDEKK